MKKVIVLLALALGACSNHKTPSANEEAFKELPLTVKQDNGQKLLVIDSLFMVEHDTTQLLSYTDLRAFGTSLMAHESAQELASVINEACRIDSLKQNNAYKNYVDSLDIGMTKNAIAYKIGKVTFSDKSTMLIWGIQNTSYEACPSFAGTYIVGSYKTKDKTYTQALLGESSSWADPPATSGKTITTQIKENGEFSSLIKTESDDLDVAGENVTVTSMDFQTDKQALKVMRLLKKVISVEAAGEQ